MLCQTLNWKVHDRSIVMLCERGNDRPGAPWLGASGSCGNSRAQCLGVLDFQPFQEGPQGLTISLLRPTSFPWGQSLNFHLVSFDLLSLILKPTAKKDACEHTPMSFWCAAWPERMFFSVAWKVLSRQSLFLPWASTLLLLAPGNFPVWH